MALTGVCPPGEDEDTETWLRESAVMLGFLLSLQAEGLGDHTAEAKEGPKWLCGFASNPLVWIQSHHAYVSAWSAHGSQHDGIPFAWVPFVPLSPRATPEGEGIAPFQCFLFLQSTPQSIKK